MPTYWKKTKNKYRANPTFCRQMHKHPSRAEANYCNQLWMLTEDKDSPVDHFEHDVTFQLVVNGVKVGRHKVDFLVTLADGTQEVHEVKGFVVRDFPLRRRLFMALYPGIKYVVIK